MDDKELKAQIRELVDEAMDDTEMLERTVESVGRFATRAARLVGREMSGNTLTPTQQIWFDDEYPSQINAIEIVHAFIDNISEDIAEAIFGLIVDGNK